MYYCSMSDIVWSNPLNSEDPITAISPIGNRVIIPVNSDTRVE
jgi:hypothetical protein